jgi:hypothetical protein
MSADKNSLDPRIPEDHPLRAGLREPLTVTCNDCDAVRTFEPTSDFSALEEAGWFWHVHPYVGAVFYMWRAGRASTVARARGLGKST